MGGGGEVEIGNEQLVCLVKLGFVASFHEEKSWITWNASIYPRLVPWYSIVNRLSYKYKSVRKVVLKTFTVHQRFTGLLILIVPLHR